MCNRLLIFNDVDSFFLQHDCWMHLDLWSPRFAIAINNTFSAHISSMEVVVEVPITMNSSPGDIADIAYAITKEGL